MAALASLLAALASGQAVIAFQNARKAAVAYAIAAVFALIGVILLITAVYIAAARQFGPVLAGIGLGVAFLIVAIVIVVASRVSSSSRATRAAKQRKADMARLGVATGIAILPSLLKGRAGVAAIATPALVGAAYGAYRLYQHFMHPDLEEQESEADYLRRKRTERRRRARE